MIEENPVKRIPRYQISLVREKTMQYDFPEAISNEEKAAAIFRELFAEADRESFAILTLDSKNRIIGVNIVSVGSLSTSIVHSRETFKLAVLQNAAAIIHGHHHPSGNPIPSREDIDAHERLKNAGEIMGIRVLDGIIIGENGYWSMQAKMERHYA